MKSASIAKPTQKNFFTLGLAAITIAMVSALPISSMPVLFKEISTNLNLDPVQIGVVWGMVSFGSIFITPLGGMLGDTLGVKRTIVIISIVAGILGASRCLADGFFTLIGLTFLWGLIAAAVLPVVSLVGSSSVPENKQGFAQGVVGAGGAVGLMLGSMLSATVVSPLVGGWRGVFLLYGGVSILIGLIWLLIGKEPRAKSNSGSQSLTSFPRIAIQIFRVKSYLALGLVFLLFQGCVMGMQGFLPYHLQEFGWTTVTSSGVITIYILAGILGIMPLTLLSDRMGPKKPYLLVTSCIVGAICVGALSFVHNDAVWVLVILAGIFAQANPALILTLCVENPEIKPGNAGTAMGILLSISLIGRAFAPPIGNSLVGVGSTISIPFIFWGILALIGGLVLLSMRKSWKASNELSTALDSAQSD